MLRKALLVLWLLALPGLAAVFPDAGNMPPTDPDAPAAIVPAAQPGGTPQRVQVDSPSARSGPTGSPIGSGVTAGSGGSGATNTRNGAQAAPAPQASVAAGEMLQPLRLPNGQPVPWSLVGLAVLLFLFSLGGGVYFWQTRDD